MISSKTRISLGVAAVVACGTVLADAHHARIPHLDRVFLIMLENHAYDQIIGNSDAPFINQMARQKNLATNFFAVGHPSLTNYLEVVGGSNFGVINDHVPDWHNSHCTPNLVSGIPSDESSSAPICPIAGSGMDAATPAVDTTNAGTPTNPVYNQPLGPAPTVGKTIADQLVAAGLHWKTYQEDLGIGGPDRVNAGDGTFTNLSPVNQADLVALYAVKHNPFAYFANVQDNRDPDNGFNNMVDFTGLNGLYADLATGSVPNFSFIVPNQCHDMHGKGGAGPFCSPANPALIKTGDVAVQKLVSAIEQSAVWKEGNNAIVVMFDENDYSSLPNKVVTLVETNYGKNGVQSNRPYNHFSLLRTLEAGFGLDCLNHACDKNVPTMDDLFAR
ncbi:MAG: alkaline phosphatase family protein [Hyphomicrobiaceae bacterium]